MRVIAKAKVNLALHVVGQRPDKLHLLDSIVAFPEYGDELLFETADQVSLSITGPFGKLLEQQTINVPNIILEAVKLLNTKNRGVRIQLIKNLPPASGVGGGSSNAAVTLKLLSCLWKEKMPKLKKILELGADVPVCLSNKFQRMQGIGETLTTLDPPPSIWIVLVNPGIKISTATIFNQLENKENGKLEALPTFPNKDNFFKYLLRQRNDLETVTLNLFPEVGVILKRISDTPNCKFFRMSGSGATCFGLYEERTHAQEAEQLLKKCFPNAWTISTTLF